MADLTALTQAVAQLQADVTSIQTEIATLKAGDPQAPVDQITAQVQTASAELQALVTPPAAPPA